MKIGLVILLRELQELGRAPRYNVTRATVTSLISLLEEKGLCVREQSTTDRRLVLVELTPAGETLIKQIFPRFNRGEAEIAASLTQEEQATLAHLLRKVINGTKTESSPSPAQRVIRQNGW